MKKKVLALALVVALAAIMVGGSLAYFTAEDEVTNTFTIGSVKIEIFENGEATDDITKPFGSLIPIVNTENPSADESYQKKVVQVKNTGANEAYVRTHIAIPKKLVGYLYLDLNTSGWSRQLPDSTATVEGVVYDVFTYDYNKALSSGEITGELLKGAYLASDVDLKEGENGNLYFVRKENGKIIHESGFLAHTKNDNGTYTSSQVNILVASQAIQAQGFDGKTATEVLNTGFPAHPWESTTN